LEDGEYLIMRNCIIHVPPNISVIKSRTKIRVHVTHMGELRNEYKVGKPKRKWRPFWKIEAYWETYIKTDIPEIGCGTTD
jgi:hypothetical protein